MNTENLSRRDFIKRSGLVGAGISGASMLPRRFLQAPNIYEVANPLAAYPNRDWEKLYRNEYAYDHSFSWVCAPKDTHNCRITVHVRNGVIVRLGEEFDIADYSDLYGNHATAKWGNRHCAKGYTFHRILYGPYWLKHRQVVGQFLVDEALAAFVHEAAEGVVAVQVNSDHDLHYGSPVG